MAKKFFTLLIFPIAVAFIGCPAPVGSLIYSVDYIKAVPNKTLYGKNDWFKPAQQVKVVGVYGGVEDPIPIDQVEIKIISDPGVTGQTEDIVEDNQVGLPLESEGPKIVVITYRGKEARYDIAVGVPGVGDPGWGEGGAGIVINWPKP